MKTLDEIVEENWIVKNSTNLKTIAKQIAIQFSKQELIRFLDRIRDYERESLNIIAFDERESEKVVDIFIKELEDEKRN